MGVSQEFYSRKHPTLHCKIPADAPEQHAAGVQRGAETNARTTRLAKRKTGMVERE